MPGIAVWTDRAWQRHVSPQRFSGAAMDVAVWLRGLGLERYEAAFRENDVSAGLLPNLTADDLKDLGIASVGHRRQLLEAIAALREPAAVKAGADVLGRAPSTGT